MESSVLAETQIVVDDTDPDNLMETVSLQESTDKLSSSSSMETAAMSASHDTVSIEKELKIAYTGPENVALSSAVFPSNVIDDRGDASQGAIFDLHNDTCPRMPNENLGNEDPCYPLASKVDENLRSGVDFIGSDNIQPAIGSSSFTAVSIPDANSSNLDDTASTANSLSKLFADEKHGTDKLGKAFFDVLAQTIVPGSSSNVLSDGADGIDGWNAMAAGVRPVESNSDGVTLEQLLVEDHFYAAWIPSSKTAQTLTKMVAAPPGTYFPEKDDLTMPGAIMTEEMKDPISDLARQYLSEDVASQRITLTADSISQDEEGLVKLINVGCYRAAVNLTTRLLSLHGQGLKKAGHPSKNSARSLQIWLVRLSLLLKLRLFNMAEAESEPFADLNKPDLYYEFHPEVYGPKRCGSMVPFAMRTLLPQILSCVGKFGEALDRLYLVLDTVVKIKENLDKGLTENGIQDNRHEKMRQASLALWKKREIKVLYTITNCLVAQNDFYSAYSLLETILEKSPENEAIIRSAQGHVLLQLGDIKSAKVSFNLAASARQGINPVQDNILTLIDRALMFIAHNNFTDALNTLKEAQSLDANNPTVINNMAVCLLYMGRLRESFHLLENAIASTPKPFLHECVIVNICTLYDLESSKSLQKKSGMLEVISRHAGDGFNVFCLKLQSMA